MECGVSDEVPHLAAHRHEESLGGSILSFRRLLHIYTEIRVAHIERCSAIPQRGQRRWPGVRHLTNAGVEERKRPPEQTAHLRLVRSAFCQGGFSVNAHPLCNHRRISLSLPDVGWYGSAYLLTNCSFQLTFGKLYTFYNIKAVLLSSVLLFEVGPIVWGTAPSCPTSCLYRRLDPPPRHRHHSPAIPKHRSVVAGLWTTIFIGAARYIFSNLTRPPTPPVSAPRTNPQSAYFLPIWFQSIKGVSAVKPGICLLTTMLGLVVATMSSGIVIQRPGYYTPFAISGVATLAVGAGLLPTFQVDSGAVKWIDSSHSQRVQTAQISLEMCRFLYWH